MPRPRTRPVNPIRVWSAWFGGLKPYMRAQVAREVTWIILGQLLAALGSLIGLRLLTAYLGRHEFGLLALSLTVPTLLASVVFAGPGQAVMRFYVAAGERGERDEILRASWRTIVVRSQIVVGVAILAGIAGWFSGYLELWPYALAAVVQAIATAFTTIFDAAQTATRRRITVAWHAALGTWLRFLLSLALFPIFGRTGLVALWGFTLAAVAVLGSQLFFHALHNRVPSGSSEGSRPAEEAGWLRRINHYSWPFTAFGLVAWLQTAAERWGLQAFSTTATVGEFAALSQIGLSVMALMGNIVAQIGLPVIYQRAGEGSDDHRMSSARLLNAQLLRVTIMLSVAAAIVAAIFHQEIFLLLVAPEFHGVSRLLPIVVLGGGLFAAGQVAMAFVLVGTSSHPLVVPKAGAAAFGAATTIAGAYWAGLVGVVWANAASSLVYLLLLVAVLWRGRRDVGVGSGATIS